MIWNDKYILKRLTNRDKEIEELKELVKLEISNRDISLNKHSEYIFDLDNKYNISPYIPTRKNDGKV